MLAVHSTADFLIMSFTLPYLLSWSLPSLLFLVFLCRCNGMTSVCCVGVFRLEVKQLRITELEEKITAVEQQLVFVASLFVYERLLLNGITN